MKPGRDGGFVIGLAPLQIVYVHAPQDGLERAGYKIVSQIVWSKSHFAISRGDYHWQHEPCWYAVKEGKLHNWQGSRSESTIWNIERGCEDKTGHATEKPVECMGRPIQNNTAAGQLVVDPFIGSGTTLIASHRLGRVCYGVELEPKYVDITLQRYFNETGDIPIRESDNAHYPVIR